MQPVQEKAPQKYLDVSVTYSMAAPLHYLQIKTAYWQGRRPCNYEDT